MKLYVATTSDKYELPIAVADNVRELAKMVGVKESSIRTIISKYEHGRLKRCNYQKIILDESELELDE